MIKLNVEINEGNAVVNYVKPLKENELIIAELLLFQRCINEIQKQINTNICEVFDLEMDKL